MGRVGPDRCWLASRLTTTTVDSTIAGMFVLSACVALGWIAEVRYSADAVALVLSNGKLAVYTRGEFDARFRA